MKISKTKFVIGFLVCAFAFQFLTSSVLGPEVRLFPSGNSSAFLGLGSPVAWKNIISMILLPIKAVLIGPLIPFINFLRQDPDTPPPFFLVGFAFYWTLLALFIYYLSNKFKVRHA
ncbi:MAG: hypothetical protein AAGC65_22610 [Mucilaginibacter sp.]|uniref:hypothetical protein n=1 Tax=Mucilaginibacter sp. TaxID=1882438 RepID=UPI0031A01520